MRVKMQKRFTLCCSYEERLQIIAMWLNTCSDIIPATLNIHHFWLLYNEKQLGYNPTIQSEKFVLLCDQLRVKVCNKVVKDARHDLKKLFNTFESL